MEEDIEENVIKAYEQAFLIYQKIINQGAAHSKAYQEAEKYFKQQIQMSFDEEVEEQQMETFLDEFQSFIEEQNQNLNKVAEVQNQKQNLQSNFQQSSSQKEQKIQAQQLQNANQIQQKSQRYQQESEESSEQSSESSSETEIERKARQAQETLKQVQNESQKDEQYKMQRKQSINNKFANFGQETLKEKLNKRWNQKDMNFKSIQECYDKLMNFKNQMQLEFVKSQEDIRALHEYTFLQLYDWIQQNTVSKKMFKELQNQLQTVIQETVPLSKYQKAQNEIQEAQEKKQKEIQDLQGNIRRMTSYQQSPMQSSRNRASSLGFNTNRSLNISESEEDINIIDMPSFVEAIDPQDQLVVSFAYFLRQAKKGFRFLKFGRTGKPHERIFYINIEPFEDEGLDDQQYNWHDLAQNSELAEVYWLSGKRVKDKSHVLIKNITSIQLGTQCTNFCKNKKYIPPNSDNLASTIQYSEIQKKGIVSRTIDFIAFDRISFDTWLFGLKLI